MIFNKILDYCKRQKYKKRWRASNKHNSTTVSAIWNQELVSIGNYTYGNVDVLALTNQSHLKVGSFCSIAPGVVFILSADHKLSNVSTFPFKVKVLQMASPEAFSKGDIVIDDDVWIGENTIILSGVHIGQGAVIGAGSVITRNVDPYSIIVGNPAKVIRKRFDDDLISELLKVDYSKLTKREISDHISELYNPFVNKAQIEWMPKK